MGEPEIAKCLKELGHEVVRYQEGCDLRAINTTQFDLLLFAKLRCGSVGERRKFLEEINIPSVCWLFDLYLGITKDDSL